MGMLMMALAGMMGLLQALPAGAQVKERIRVVWGLGMERDTDEGQQEMVRLAAEVGFDALAVKQPSAAVVHSAHEAGMLVIETITPSVSREFADDHPGQIQAMLPLEEELAERWRAHKWAQRTAGSFRWQPVFHRALKD